jgi:hypothetical protein
MKFTEFVLSFGKIVVVYCPKKIMAAFKKNTAIYVLKSAHQSPI